MITRLTLIVTALVLAVGLWGAALVLLQDEPAQAQVARAFDDVQSFTIRHNGMDRTFGLYVPRSYARGTPAPLVVALHGRFASADSLHALSHLQQLAERRGALLLYPEARGVYWADGGHAALGRPEPANDDAGFIGEAVAAIMADHTINRDQVFLVGHDSGGAMAMRLACQPPVKFAGVAIVSALMWDFTARDCPQAHPATSILFVHGRGSELFPVDGATSEPPATATRLGEKATLEFWLRANACPVQGAGSAERFTAAGCRDGTRVAYVGIPGAQQAWVHGGKPYALNRHGTDTAAMVEGFFFGGSDAGLSAGERPNATPRDYLVFVPPGYDARTPMPVMVLLHGRPSNAAAMARITDMNAVARRHGFIVVYPEGLNNEWNAQFDLYTTSSRSVHTSGNESVGLKQDDVGFLKTLMADLRLDLNIDPARMYIAGFSNGGFMTMRMACSAADTFAAFAEVGSALYPVMADLCRGSKPTPILFMHGTKDPSIPIDGVRVRDSQSGIARPVTWGVKETVALFAKRNGCSNTGLSTTFGTSGRSPGTFVVRFVPKDCRPNTPVVFWIVDGGGHTWPGVAGVMDEQRFGLTNMDINASEKIWEFVSPHRRTP